MRLYNLKMTSAAAATAAYEWESIIHGHHIYNTMVTSNWQSSSL